MDNEFPDGWDKNMQNGLYKKIQKYFSCGGGRSNPPITPTVNSPKDKKKSWMDKIRDFFNIKPNDAIHPPKIGFA